MRLPGERARVQRSSQVVLFNSYFTRGVKGLLLTGGFHYSMGPFKVLCGPLSVIRTL